MEKEVRTFNDRPINFTNGANERNIGQRFADHDDLGVSEYAYALGDFILECSTPISIGLQGDWGIGKTSMLNMLDAYLSTRRGAKARTIWFNTWQYSLFNQDTVLGAAVINALLEELRTTFSIGTDRLEKSKKAIGKVMSVLSGVSVAGMSIDPKKMFEKDAGLEERLGYHDLASMMLDFRNEFERLVQEITDNPANNTARIVFFIDDLDRVKPVKAIELLESLKNFLDVPRCVFVLAVDYQVVQMGMADKLGVDLQSLNGKSFFDKLIQLPFTMPSASYNLKAYVGKLLERSGFIGSRTLGDAEAEFYGRITACTIGGNPRSIKRAANYAMLLEKVRWRNRESKDSMTILDRQVLYALICMQIAWPEIFNYFVKQPTTDSLAVLEDWDHLERVPHINRLWQRSPDSDQVKSNISAFFDILFDLLDVDGNGEISDAEFRTIWKVLKLARMTNADTYLSSWDRIRTRVFENSRSNGDAARVVMEAMTASKWRTDPRADFKYSGSRYGTLVVDRKQMGTIVSLKSESFALRLVCDPDDARAALEKRFPNDETTAHIVESGGAKKQTGFGNTYIASSELAALGVEKATKVLNCLFDRVAQP